MIIGLEKGKISNGVGNDLGDIKTLPKILDKQAIIIVLQAIHKSPTG
jgi:hypothetical protein